MRALLEIANRYEDETIYTYPEAEIDPPPAGAEEGSEAIDKWAMDELFPYTGTGKTDGNSTYDVRIVECDDPTLVGRTFGFG